MRPIIIMSVMAVTLVSTSPLEAQCEGFFEQPGAAEAGVDCVNRPPGSVCLGFSDGFIWLIYDAIAGWNPHNCGDKAVVVAWGFKGEYHHVLGTDKVRFVPYDLEGTIGGLVPKTAFCQNHTTGQKLVAHVDDAAWDCEELGLIISEGDLVVTGLGGTASGPKP